MLPKLTEGGSHLNHLLRIRISLKERLSGNCTLTRQQTCTQASLANTVCEFFLRDQSQVTLPSLMGICLSVPWALDLGAVSSEFISPSPVSLEAWLSPASGSEPVTTGTVSPPGSPPCPAQGRSRSRCLCMSNELSGPELTRPWVMADTKPRAKDKRGSSESLSGKVMEKMALGPSLA